MENDDSTLSEEDVKTILADLENKELMDENGKYTQGTSDRFRDNSTRNSRWTPSISMRLAIKTNKGIPSTN